MEKWAVYSSYPSPHKITGSLTDGVYSCLGYFPLLSYVCKKQNLSLHHMDLINLEALHNFLAPKPVHTRATYAKLLHNWTPTHAHLCQQGSEQTPLCPRCNNAIETSSHMLICSSPNSITCRNDLLHTYLKYLVALQSPMHVLATLEYKLALTLNVPYIQLYWPVAPLPPNIHNKLISTIRSQNIIGWDSFLKGFIVKSLRTLYEDIIDIDPPLSCNCGTQPWDFSFIALTLSLYKDIWNDQNSHLHGSNQTEAAQLPRQRVIQAVEHLYAHPPRLDKCFPNIRLIPINQGLRKSTTHLKRWLSHVEQQKRVSKALLEQSSGNQLKIPNLFHRFAERDSLSKYPP
jgi:hypothetical protein